jgi:hypothetical protein
MAWLVSKTLTSVVVLPKGNPMTVAILILEFFRKTLASLTKHGGMQTAGKSKV